MNYTLAGTLIAVLLIFILLFNIYRWGYRSGQRSPVDVDEQLEQAKQQVRILQYKLAFQQPQPADDCIVLDYSQHPPVARPATVIDYNDKNNTVMFRYYGDVYPLTGRFHNGIIVMLDYAQEC